MAPDCCRGRARARRGRGGSALTLALGVALALVPKCPMCIAAYLSVFGLGMAAAGALAPWCLPLALLLILASAARFFGVRWVRSGSAQRTS